MHLEWERLEIAQKNKNNCLIGRLLIILLEVCMHYASLKCVQYYFYRIVKECMLAANAMQVVESAWINILEAIIWLIKCAV